MILPYYYWFFPSAWSSEFCDKIVELGVTTLHERKEKFGVNAVNASVGGWRQKGQAAQNSFAVNDKDINQILEEGLNPEQAYVRDSEVAFFGFSELYDAIWPFIKEANARAGWNFDWNYTEEFQFTKYGINQFYGWHCDSSEKPYELFDPKIHAYHKNPDGTPYIDQYGEMSPEDHNHTVNRNYAGKIRKLSVTVSLNDPSEYDGGTLKFDLGPHRADRYHVCEEIKPKGSIVVFPSHLYHQVTPVTRGTRYSLVCWNLGPPFK